MMCYQHNSISGDLIDSVAGLAQLGQTIAAFVVVAAIAAVQFCGANRLERRLCHPG